MLTKSQLSQLNKTMLGLGAPVVIDGKGYNKMDYSNMYDMAEKDFDKLTDRQVWWVAKTLERYKNTQLKQYKEDIESTVRHYAEISDKTKVFVVGKTDKVLQLRWNYVDAINRSLKNELDKRQYSWTKDNGKWILNVNWNYVNTLVAVLERHKLKCTDVRKVMKNRPVTQVETPVKQEQIEQIDLLNPERIKNWVG